MSIGAWFAESLIRGHPGSRSALPRLREMRFWALDVDITGTDSRSDTVYGIAVLPVEAGKFSVSGLIYLPVAGDPGAWEEPGPVWRDRYLELRERMGADPVVTYNRTFVRFMMERACGGGKLPLPGGAWLDLADAFKSIGAGESEVTRVDYWLARMRSGGPHPHDAAYDVFCMAQMLLAVLAYSEDAGVETLDSLARVQSGRAWLRHT